METRVIEVDLLDDCRKVYKEAASVLTEARVGGNTDGDRVRFGSGCPEHRSRGGGVFREGATEF